MFQISQEHVETEIVRLSPDIRIEFLIAPNRNARQISTRHHAPTYEKLYNEIVEKLRYSFGCNIEVARLPTAGAILGAFEITVLINGSERYNVFSKLKANKFPTVKLVMKKLCLLLGIRARTELPQPMKKKGSTENSRKDNRFFRVFIKVVSVYSGTAFKLQSERNLRTEAQLNRHGVGYAKCFDEIGELSTAVEGKESDVAFVDLEENSKCKFVANIEGWKQVSPLPEQEFLIDEKGPAIIRIFMAIPAKLTIQTKTKSGFSVPYVELTIREKGNFCFGSMKQDFKVKTDINGQHQIFTKLLLGSTVDIGCEETRLFTKLDSPISVLLNKEQSRADDKKKVSAFANDWLYDSDSDSETPMEEKHQNLSLDPHTNDCFDVVIDQLVPKWRWCCLKIPLAEYEGCICPSYQNGLRLRVSHIDLNGKQHCTRLWCPCFCGIFHKTYGSTEPPLKLSDLALVPNACVEIQLSENDDWIDAILLKRLKTGNFVCYIEEDFKNRVELTRSQVRPAPVAFCREEWNIIKREILRDSRFCYKSSFKSIEVFIETDENNISCKVGDKLSLANGMLVGILSGILNLKQSKKVLKFENGIKVDLPLGTKLYVNNHKILQTGTDIVVTGIVGGMTITTFGTSTNGCHGPFMTYIGFSQHVSFNKGLLNKFLWGDSSLKEILNANNINGNIAILNEGEWNRRTNRLAEGDLTQEIVPAERWGELPAPPGSTRVFAKVNEDLSIRMECNSESHLVKTFSVNAASEICSQALIPPESIMKLIRTEQKRRKLSFEEHMGAASIIQRKYRRILLQQKKNEQIVAAKHIQRIYRFYLARNEQLAEYSRLAATKCIQKFVRSCISPTQNQFREKEFEKYIEELSTSEDTLPGTNISKEDTYTLNVNDDSGSCNSEATQQSNTQEIDGVDEHKLDLTEDESFENLEREIQEEKLKRAANKEQRKQAEGKLLLEARQALEKSRNPKLMQSPNLLEEKADEEYSDYSSDLSSNSDLSYSQPHEKGEKKQKYIVTSPQNDISHEKERNIKKGRVDKPKTKKYSKHGETGASRSKAKKYSKRYSSSSDSGESLIQTSIESREARYRRERKTRHEKAKKEERTYEKSKRKTKEKRKERRRKSSKKNKKDKKREEKKNRKSSLQSSLAGAPSIF